MPWIQRNDIIKQNKLEAYLSLNRSPGYACTVWDKKKLPVAAMLTYIGHEPIRKQNC